MNTSHTGLSVSEFVKLLKSSRNLIFHNDDIPKTNQMSQLHVVALQMLAKGIIKLVVSVKTKIRTSKIMSADILMTVRVKGVKGNGRMFSTPYYMIDKY